MMNSCFAPQCNHTVALLDLGHLPIVDYWTLEATGSQFLLLAGRHAAQKL